jgi:hypothetical protein
MFFLEYLLTFVEKCALYIFNLSLLVKDIVLYMQRSRFKLQTFHLFILSAKFSIAKRKEGKIWISTKSTIGSKISFTMLR